jgi:hypothetical protein
MQRIPSPSCLLLSMRSFDPVRPGKLHAASLSQTASTNEEPSNMVQIYLLGKEFQCWTDLHGEEFTGVTDCAGSEAWLL